MFLTVVLPDVAHGPRMVHPLLACLMRKWDLFLDIWFSGFWDHAVPGCSLSCSSACPGMVIVLFWDGHLPVLGWSSSSGMVSFLFWDGHLLGW